MPCAVVVFALRGGEGDRSEHELRRAEMTGLISVHAAAYRRSALVSESGGRTYVLLPDLAPNAQLLNLTREIVTTARRHLHTSVQAAVGSTVSTLDEAQVSRQEAERVLDAMARDLDAEVATLADVRSQVLVSEILALLQDNPRIRDPRIDALDPELAKSLLAYLDALGDVRAAADRLHVHPNTLRYRLKRIDLDLEDPLVRLIAQLQLRMR